MHALYHLFGLPMSWRVNLVYDYRHGGVNRPTKSQIRGLVCCQTIEFLHSQY